MSDTPAAAVSDYLDHIAVERGLSPHTVAAYRRDLDRWLAHLESARVQTVADVRPEHLRTFLDGLVDAGLARTSIARTVVAVRSLHRFLAEERRTADDPTAEVRPPTPGRRLPKALPLSEVERLIASADPATPTGLRDAALLELLYGTGARISEVLALDVDDVQPLLADPEDDTLGLRLLGKGGKERMVPLGGYARAAVAAWLVRGRPGWSNERSGAALLLNSRGGRLSRTSAWGVLRAAAERAGIDAEISPHSLRHSFATHLLDGGADVRVVQELLGHASVTTTQIYTLVTVDHLREVYLETHPRAR